MSPEVRPEVWKFLLGLYSFTSTTQQRASIDREHHKVYADLSERAAKADNPAFAENCKIIGGLC